MDIEKLQARERFDHDSGTYEECETIDGPEDESINRLQEENETLRARVAELEAEGAKK